MENGTQEFQVLVVARNGPVHRSQPRKSPASDGQSAGIWRVVAGKKGVCMRLGPFLLNRAEVVLFRRPETTCDQMHRLNKVRVPLYNFYTNVID